MNISGLSLSSSNLSSFEINPQPLPPRSSSVATNTSLWNSALNPQPLPPRIGTGLSGAQDFASDDFCGNRPPGPPIPHLGIFEG